MKYISLNSIIDKNEDNKLIFKDDFFHKNI
jgi:hypothetical protein